MKEEEKEKKSGAELTLMSVKEIMKSTIKEINPDATVSKQSVHLIQKCTKEFI